jgi:hypothetical protein
MTGFVDTMPCLMAAIDRQLRPAADSGVGRGAWGVRRGA